MRNPPRTQQNSIFEPLFSTEEVLRTPPTHLIHSSSSEWLSSTFSATSPSADKAYCNNQELRKAPTTIFNEEMSTHQQHKCAHHLELVGDFGRSMQSGVPAPSRSLSVGNIDKDDDGSVASKLLTSITKSLSSPSLLSCCKEPTRETPYQKALKLRMMKLQHCAEELGSESSDGALIYSNGGVNSAFDSFSTMSSSRLSTASSFASPLPCSPIPQNDQEGEWGDASPMMISVRSAPNLGCPSLVSRHTSHSRERSFPPPLTSTLTRSASADSFTFALRAHREDGHFMLKEVKVPSPQYLRANRKGGRLTLHLFTSASEDVQQEDYVHKELDVQQDESVAGICEGGQSAVSDKGDMVGCSYNHKQLLESAAIVEGDADADGDAEVIERKEGKEIRDDVNMVEFEQKISMAANSDARTDGGLSAKSLCMAAINVDDDGKAYEVSHVRASDMKRMEFSGIDHCEPEKWVLVSTSRPDGHSTPFLGDTPRLNVMSPLIRLAQCEENMQVLQRSSNRKTSDMKGRRSMLGLEISSTPSWPGAGFDIETNLSSSTIIFQDVGRRALVENVTKLVNSFGIDGEKWCQRKLKSRDLVLERRAGFKCGQLKDSSMVYNGITSINIGVRKVDKNGPHEANGRKIDTLKAIVDVEGESKPHCIGGAVAKEAGGIMDMNERGLSTTKPTTLHFDVLLPLNYDWLHNLHCKELPQRSHFANKGFPYVAIRS